MARAPLVPTQAGRRGAAPLRAVLLAAALAGALLGCGTPQDPPDVLLVVVDTLRADRLGAYGFSADTSPNLDALAARSVVFERAIAASGATAPSHASIMASRFVREHSIGWTNGSTRLVDVPTLAESFQAAGYATAAFVSNYVIQRRVGLDRGFDVYDDALPTPEPNRPTVYERTAPATAELAVEWLEQPREQPFFLWVHFQDPHGPYTPPAEYVERFEALEDPDEEPLPVLDVQRGWRGIPAYQALDGLTRPSAYQRRYAAEIAYFDASLGRLLEAARRSAGDELVVLLTADHGESLGEADYWFAHGHGATPDLVRVPFLLSAPGLEPERRSELVHHVDVLPTLLDLAGLPIPEGARGQALGRLLRSEESLPDRLVFSDVGKEVSAYHDDVLVQVRNEQGIVNGRQGTWRTYTWQPGNAPERAPPRPALRPAIQAYLELVPELAPALQALDEADRERLRALGYLEPESGADPGTGSDSAAGAGD